MGRPRFEAARAYALGRLERELDPRLCYHTLAHTSDEVLPMAEYLSALEGVDGDDRVDLLTAALFHDIGFVVNRVEHEAIGAQIAAAVLPGLDYEQARVDRIAGMIMATRMPQSPHTLLEQILADADLDILGRENFLERNGALRAEVENFNGPIADRQWYEDQIAFLEQHRYWTAAARRLRDGQKAQHILAFRKTMERFE